MLNVLETTALIHSPIHSCQCRLLPFGSALAMWIIPFIRITIWHFDFDYLGTMFDVIDSAFFHHLLLLLFPFLVRFVFVDSSIMTRQMNRIRSIKIHFGKMSSDNVERIKKNAEKYFCHSHLIIIVVRHFWFLIFFFIELCATPFNSGHIVLRFSMLHCAQWYQHLCTVYLHFPLAIDSKSFSTSIECLRI